MSVATVTKASVRAATQTRSTVYVSNELIRCVFETVKARGLPLDYAQSHQELFHKSFRTWLSGRWLRELIIEVYDTATDRLLEKFAIAISYEPAATGEELFFTSMGKLQAGLAKLPPLKPGARYRLSADVTPEAPSLPGWKRSPLRDASHLRRLDFGSVIDTLHCRADMAVWAEGGQQECK